MRQTRTGAIGPGPRWSMHCLADKGVQRFDDHFDDAFKQIFALGYESVVSVGGDIPTYAEVAHPRRRSRGSTTSRAWDTPGFVQAPCQECGTSLVGFSRNTPIDPSGRLLQPGRPWPRSTPTWRSCRRKDIPSAYFSPVADIDETHRPGARHFLHARHRGRREAPGRTCSCRERVLDLGRLHGHPGVHAPQRRQHDPRQYIDE